MKKIIAPLLIVLLLTGCRWPSYYMTVPQEHCKIEPTGRYMLKAGETDEYVTEKVVTCRYAIWD